MAETEQKDGRPIQRVGDSIQSRRKKRNIKKKGCDKR